MPQEFQVLQCFSCKTFQVHQVKKALKWACKLCGEKQSVIKVYGRGTGAECRHHVQRLNTMRGEMETSLPQSNNRIDDYQTNNTGFLSSDEGCEQENEGSQFQEPSVGKWEQFVEQEDAQEVEDVDTVEDPLYTTDATLVRSRGRGKKRQNFSRESGYNKKRKMERFSNYDTDKSHTFTESNRYDYPEYDHNNSDNHSSNFKKTGNRYTKHESTYQTSYKSKVEQNMDLSAYESHPYSAQPTKWGQYTENLSDLEENRSLSTTDYFENTATQNMNHNEDQILQPSVNKVGDKRKNYNNPKVNDNRQRSASKWDNFLEEQEEESETVQEEPEYFTEKSKLSVNSTVKIGSSSGNSKWNTFIEEKNEDNSTSENMDLINGKDGLDINTEQFQHMSRKPLEAKSHDSNASVTSRSSNFVNVSSVNDENILDAKNDKVLKPNNFVAPSKLAKSLLDSNTNKKQPIFSLGDLSDDDLEFSL